MNAVRLPHKLESRSNILEKVPKIDVVLPTWNSNGPCFSRVIQSVLDNCFVCHLIVIDRHSGDGTVDVLRKNVPKENLRLFVSDADLAQARRIAAEVVDTEWFAYVDSDVELCDNWHAKMWRYTKVHPRIGAVQAVFSNSQISRTYKGAEVLYLQKHEELTLPTVIRYGLFNLTKGLTAQTLIKKDAIRGWRPSKNLCAFEDYHLTQHLLKNGWKWIRVLSIHSTHHKGHEDTGFKISLYYKQGLWEGAGAQLMRIHLPTLLVEIGARFLGGSFKSLKHHNCIKFMENFAFRLGYLIGYLKPNEFRRQVR